MNERIIKLRSFMFLPAHNRKFIEKALLCNADGIILDLEDAVPPNKRENARTNIVEFCMNGRLIERENAFVRVNPIDSDDFVEDISQLTIAGIDGFMLSKIESAKEIEFMDGLLSFFEKKRGLKKGSFKLAPLIETTKAIENVYDIACASKRLVALCLGGEDYLNDLGSVYTYQESALYYARMRLVNASRAVGLLPIDTPFLDINDVEEFKNKSKQAYKNGFAGGLILNPKQIDTANEAFSPDDEMIIESNRIIEEVNKVIEKDASGVAMLNGAMIGPPMRKRAENVMKQIRDNRKI